MSKNDDNSFQAHLPTYYHTPNDPQRRSAGLEKFGAAVFLLLLAAYFLL